MCSSNLQPAVTRCNRLAARLRMSVRDLAWVCMGVTMLASCGELRQCLFRIGTSSLHRPRFQDGNSIERDIKDVRDTTKNYSNNRQSYKFAITSMRKGRG